MNNEMSEWVQLAAKERKSWLERAAKARVALVGNLRRVGVEKVHAEFDGSGDSGNVEAICYTPDIKDIGKQEVPDTPHEVREWLQSGDSKVVIRNYTFNELVEEVCYGILEAEHGGWEINEGAFGEFVIDAKKNSVSLQYNQRIESVETSDEDY